MPDGDFVPCYSNNIIRRPGGRSWVVEQIEKWKAEDTQEARKNLKKLFSAYSDSRGQREKPKKADWLICRQLKDRISKGKTFEKAVEDLINDADGGKLDPDIQEVLIKYVQDENAGYYNTFHEISIASNTADLCYQGAREVQKIVKRRDFDSEKRLLVCG